MGAVGPLRVTYRSTKSNRPSPPPIWRRALGAQGGAVPRQLGRGDVRPTRSLSSGHLSSGEGARRAEFPCLFPISLPGSVSPQSPPLQGLVEVLRKPHFPKTRGSVPPAQRGGGASSPSHDSPHVLSPEFRQRKRGSSHVGPSISDY